MSLLRPTLIALSHSKLLQQSIVRVPMFRRMARRFVAGERLEDAIDAVLDLNARGMLSTLDHLGENVINEAATRTAAGEYILALAALDLAEAQCNISVKLTQMGLDLGDDLCYANVRRVVEHAASCGCFVRVDMEGSAYTERTLTIYRRLRRDFDNVGIVIQAYLHRSKADVEALIAEGAGHFRLCKGAYDEPETIAYREPRRVTQSLNDLVCTCLDAQMRGRKVYCAVASHDEAVVNFARAYASRNHTPRDGYEFQMLYGIRRELQTALVQQGYAVRIYVPYGTHWYPYFMRRLAERPANLLFFLRAFFGD